MEFHVLASGSKGNSTFIYDDGIGILIDCGISRKQLVYKLSQIGFNQDNINYVLLTHDHSDHKKNISIFDLDMCYCGVGCIQGISDDNVLDAYNTYDFDHLKITPLAISHDATTPLAFVIEGKDESLLYMTDTGYVSKKNRPYIQDLDYYIIESNHDVEMLMETRRPDFLKKRIYGIEGHLNNEYSAHLMAEVMGEKTKEIVLAHLSQEANTEEKALETYQEIFNDEGINFNNIKIASQVNIISGGKIHED